MQAPVRAASALRALAWLASTSPQSGRERSRIRLRPPKRGPSALIFDQHNPDARRSLVRSVRFHLGRFRHGHGTEQECRQLMIHKHGRLSSHSAVVNKARMPPHRHAGRRPLERGFGLTLALASSRAAVVAACGAIPRSDRQRPALIRQRRRVRGRDGHRPDPRGSAEEASKGLSA